MASHVILLYEGDYLIKYSTKRRLLGFQGTVVHKDKGVMLLNAVALFLDGEKI